MFFEGRVPTASRDSFRADWRAASLDAVALALTLPFASVIARQKLGASAFEIGVISAAPAVGCLFTLLWANMMHGRLKKPFHVWSILISRALLLAMLFATRSWIFVAVVSAFYFVGSISGPAYSALMKLMYPDTDRARVMSYVKVCSLTVYVAVTAAAGLLMKLVSFRYAIPFAALFGIGAALVFNRVRVDEAVPPEKASLAVFVRDAVGVFRSDPAYRSFCLGIFIFGWAGFMILPAYTLYQVDVLHVDTRWAGVYAVVSASASMISYVYWGSYIDRRDPLRVVLGCTLFWAVIPLSYCFINHAWMLVPVSVFGGVIAAGCELAYFSGVLHFAPADRITQYQALFASLIGIRGIAAPYLGAWLLQSHIASQRTVFLMTALLILCAFIVQLAGLRRYGTRRRRSREH